MPICEACGQEGADKCCSRCKESHYCSIVCQKRHWKAGHKHKCVKAEKPSAATAAAMAAAATPRPDAAGGVAQRSGGGAGASHNEKCAICLDALQQPQMMPCGHRFCRGCVASMRQHGAAVAQVCPLCRGAMPNAERMHAEAERLLTQHERWAEGQPAALLQASSMLAGIRKPRTDTAKRSIIASVTAAMAVRDVFATVACRMARPMVEPAASLADDVRALPCALQQRIALMATPTAPAVVAELRHAFELGDAMGCELAHLHFIENRHTNEGLDELPAANICAVQYLRGHYGALCQVIQLPPHVMKKPFFNIEMTIDDLREYSADPDFPMDEFSAWANDMDLSFTGPADPVRECQARPKLTSFECPYEEATNYWGSSAIANCVMAIALGKKHMGTSFVSGGLTPIRPPPSTSTFSFVRPPLSERH